MTSETYDPEQLVTIDAYDVDPDGLAGDGDTWSRVVPTEVDDRIGAVVSARLPVSGWRELRSPTTGSGFRVFAAPHQGGWAVAYLAPNGILSADPGPFAVRPSRAARRAGLTLEWRDEGILAADVAGLSVALTNTSGRTWVPDPDDHGYVHGWFVRDGRRLGPDTFAFAPLGHLLHSLEPGESLMLAVEFDARLGSPPPGDYEVEAALTALDLWTVRHALRVS